jgi:hypothetical protein
METEASTRTANRRRVLAGIAHGFARDWNTEKAFRNSQAWDGYQKAFDSWARAMWQWIDGYLTRKEEGEWRARLLARKDSFSSPKDPSLAARYEDIEWYLQSYLVRRAYFLGGLSHSKQGDPEWFKAFGFYFYLAAVLDDDHIFAELARLTRRKPSQDQGRRSLRFWLLCLWVPGCLWALTNGGIAALLVWPDADEAQGQSRLYSEGSVRNMISDLNLWRPVKPLFWGLNSGRELVCM